MKRFICFICVLLLISFWADSRTLKIMRLSTSTIKIGNNTCKVGDTFSDGDIIHWSSPKQVMWVKYTDGENRDKLYLSMESFAARNAKTPREYFIKINHPSVRDDRLDLIEGKNKSQFVNKRIALVIGNSNYSYIGTLSNPINDATDVTERLVSLGFDVYMIHDAKYEDFETAIKVFCRHAQQKEYDVAILFFSGHGISYLGQSYLIPIDVLLGDADDIDNCIDLEDVYSRMGRTNCSTNLIVIDACRTEKDWNKKQHQQQRVKEPNNVGVFFSTAPGSVALDGEGRNSPFAKAFIQSIGEPSTSLLSTINTISERVELETNYAQSASYRGKTSFPFTFVEASFKQIFDENNQIIDSTLYCLEQYEKGLKLYKENLFEKALPYFKIAAEGDILGALVKLAEYYCEVDSMTLAEEYAKRAADVGCRQNSKLYGDIEKLYGDVLYNMDRKDEALDRYVKSAEQGNDAAAMIAASMYRDGIGVIADTEKAVFWFRKVANPNNSYINSSVALIFNPNINHARQELKKMGKSIYDRSFIDIVNDHIKSIPKEMDAEELYNIANTIRNKFMLFLGGLTPEQLAYMIASAEKGSPKAQNQLGRIFEQKKYKDLGIYDEVMSKQWYEAAYNSYKKLAEEGNEEAIKALGSIYMEGNRAVEKNLEIAEQLFRKGANLGNIECCLLLGKVLYEEGKKEESFLWLTKSANQGDMEAAYLVGQMYEYGDGIPWDTEKAIEWYITCARWGNSNFSSKAQEALNRLRSKPE